MCIRDRGKAAVIAGQGHKSRLTLFARATVMPFWKAAYHIFDKKKEFILGDKLQCDKVNRDETLKGYFEQWMVDIYGKETASPAIMKGTKQVVFLKKSKKLKKKSKVHQGAVLIKTMVCLDKMEAGEISTTQCCVNKELALNTQDPTARSKEEDALATTLQLW